MNIFVLFTSREREREEKCIIHPTFILQDSWQLRLLSMIAAPAKCKLQQEEREEEEGEKKEAEKDDRI